MCTVLWALSISYPQGSKFDSLQREWCLKRLTACAIWSRIQTSCSKVREIRARMATMTWLDGVSPRIRFSSSTYAYMRWTKSWFQDILRELASNPIVSFFRNCWGNYYPTQSRLCLVEPPAAAMYSSLRSPLYLLPPSLYMISGHLDIWLSKLLTKQVGLDLIEKKDKKQLFNWWTLPT